MSQDAHRLSMKFAPAPVTDVEKEAQAVAGQSDPAGYAGIETVWDIPAQHGYGNPKASSAWDALVCGAVHISNQAALPCGRLVGDQAVQYEAMGILKEKDAAGAQGGRWHGGNRYAFTGSDGRVHAVAVHHCCNGLPLLQEGHDDIPAFLQGACCGWVFERFHSE